MKKIIIVILAMMMAMVLNVGKEENMIIPEEAIRVRVIANSKDSYDIEVKENLRKDLSEEIYGLLKGATTIEEARTTIQKNLENLDISVEKNLQRQNYPKNFNINYGMNYFPKKEFKGVTYEEGYYESLVVTLGEGKGDNWWCVLFPPLCLLDFEEESLDDLEYQTFVGELIEKYF